MYNNNNKSNNNDNILNSNTTTTPKTITPSTSITSTTSITHPISETKINISSNTENKSIYRKNDPNTRYDENGTRYQSVAIPFRYTNNSKQPVELLMITSRRLGDLVFCGGGWEKTETGSEAALREAKEEAGILGQIICELYSDHNYLSDKQNSSRVWFYLMQVTDELEIWDENSRERKWLSIDAADAGLGQKRRSKFHNAWMECMKWFIDNNLYSATNVTGPQIEKYDEQQRQPQSLENTDKHRITFTSHEIYYNANASSFNKTVFIASTSTNVSTSANTSAMIDVGVDVNHNNKSVVSSDVISNESGTVTANTSAICASIPNMVV